MPMLLGLLLFLAAEWGYELRTLYPDRMLKNTAIDRRVFLPQSGS
jgi:hypothetical protein